MLEERMNKYDELLTSLQLQQVRTGALLEEITRQNTRQETHQDKLEDAHLEMVRLFAELKQKQGDDVVRLEVKQENALTLIDEKSAHTLRYAAVILSLAFLVAGVLTGILSSVIQHAFFH